MTLEPITVKAALPFVREVHRRLPVLQGAMWAVQVLDEGIRIGVGVVGRPTARLLDNGRRLQVLRVAVREGHKNACSMIYGATSRAAKALGASDLFTYIHDDESGVSLRAAGWLEDVGFSSDGGEWSRGSRPRQATVEPGKKRRFFAPWSEMFKALRGPKPTGEET